MHSALQITLDFYFQTVPEFVAEEKELLGQPPLNITPSTYSSYCHDNTWILAYALNDTLNSKSISTLLNIAVAIPC